MKENKEKNLMGTIVPIVLAFLGVSVLINMIQQKSIVNGIQAFIIGFKGNFITYIISIGAVIVGTFIGLNLRKKNEEE